MSNDVPAGAQPLRPQETDDDRAGAHRRLGEMRAVARSWHRLLEDPLIPQVGSSLAADDQAYPEYATSHVAWTGIRSAIDAMSMFFASLDGDRVAYETGHRAVARAALGGAAQAVFVLAPPRRALRTARALRLAFDDLGSYERALQDMKESTWSADPTLNDDAKVWEETFDRVAGSRVRMVEAARAVGLSNTQLGRAPSFREMADFAAEELPDTRGQDVLNSLRMSLAQLNSAAHSGRWHALLTATHSIETPHGSFARLVTTATDLMLMASGPMVLTPRALELFQVRAVW